MCKLQRISNMAVVALLLGVAAASAGELPQYEVGGLSISPHQISVLGLGGIQEQSPTPTLTLNGMPAFLHTRSRCFSLESNGKLHTNSTKTAPQTEGACPRAGGRKSRAAVPGKTAARFRGTCRIVITLEA